MRLLPLLPLLLRLLLTLLLRVENLNIHVRCLHEQIRDLEAPERIENFLDFLTRFIPGCLDGWLDRLDGKVNTRRIRLYADRGRACCADRLLVLFLVIGRI